MQTIDVAESTAELGMPMQLIRRDRYGKDIDVLDIFGPDLAEPGVCLMEGYSGFYHTPRTPIREKSAYSEGSKPTGTPRVDERIIQFVLATQSPTAAGWERIENRLWKFLKTGRDCFIRLYSVLSEPRELRIRLTKTPTDLFKRGPGLIRNAMWVIEAFAYDPFWYSETISRSVFRSQMTLDNGIYKGVFPVNNPADQQCWLQFSSNTLTTATTVWLPDHLSGRMVKLPELIAGREFLVQTHPLAETLLVMDDTNQWAKMRAASFGEVPLPEAMEKTVNVPVWIQGGTATTEIAVHMEQRWDRMFGGEGDDPLELAPASVVG